MKNRFLNLGLAAGVILIATAGPLSAAPQNLALGADTSESDSGWGGGASPADMVDGSTYYTDTWAHGLAFTGGTGNWAGEPCGARQATLDFGTPQTFERVLVWHHGTDHIPTTYHLEVWDGSSWSTVGGSSSVRWDLEVPPQGAFGWGATPTEQIFPPVTGSKVRFALNNCNITHGWIYEFEVFGDTTPQYRLPFVGLENITNGPGCGSQGVNHHGFTAEAIDYDLDFEPVYATEEGDVIFAGSVSGGGQASLAGFGTHIIIQHADGSKSYYAHLSQVIVSGGHVDKGQLIAISGDSGKVKGAHLHFQIMDSKGAPISIRTLPDTFWSSGDPNNPCNRKPRTIDGYAEGPPVP
jgi:hypothetical protein